jgi:hypothetical protein
MNRFDRICAVFAFLFATVLVLAGILGLFLGCHVHFTLPPVLGVLPAFAGWGIIRCVILAWNAPINQATQATHEGG